MKSEIKVTIVLMIGLLGCSTPVDYEEVDSISSIVDIQQIKLLK